MLKRMDETSQSANAAKAERNEQMVHGQILNTDRMDDQQPSPEQGKVQRPERKLVHRKLLTVEVAGIPSG